MAEVNNTFGDRHSYAGTGPLWHDKKVVHVSPFFSLAGSYAGDLPEPDAARVEALRLWRKGARVFPNPGYEPQAARKEVA